MWIFTSVYESTSRYHKNLQQAIARSMAYWFYRMILGWGAVRSDIRARSSSRLTRLGVSRNGRRRRYQALRAGGLSYYETKARMRGVRVSPEQVRQLHIQAQRRYLHRWGGQPSNVGSPAWRRWMLAR